MPFSASKCTCRKTWHPRFLRLLPQIYDYAIPAFRDLQRDEREEAVQETVAQAFVLFVRLMQRRRAELVFPTIIARFAIARVREGRTLGTGLNSRDVSSRYAQRKRGFSVGRLDRRNGRKDRWLEAMVEDHHTPVVDQVCFRIDFPEWLARLSRRNRRIAESLACGNSTNDVAREFRLTAARVSQLRRELRASWEGFHERLAAVGTHHPQQVRPANRRQKMTPRHDSSPRIPASPTPPTSAMENPLCRPGRRFSRPASIQPSSDGSHRKLHRTPPGAAGLRRVI